MSELLTLTAAERAEFAQDEKTLTAHLRSFWLCGEALRNIRDKTLYREQYKTYEEYCQKRWDFTSSRARQLVNGIMLATEIQSVTEVTLQNEQQARAANSLPPSVRAAAVAAAAAAGKVTAAAIKQEGEKLIVERTPDQQARDVVYASPYIPIKQKPKLGALTPQKALLIVDALNGCKPMMRGDLLRLNISDPTVIRMLSAGSPRRTRRSRAPGICNLTMSAP